MATKKYLEFIKEWGTDANKPQIKVGDRIIDEIEIDPEQDEEGNEIEDQLQIMFARVDMSESIIREQTEVDPFGEENWNEKEPEFSYIKWRSEKKELYDFLKQLKNDYIDSMLNEIEVGEKKDFKNKTEDIMAEISYYDSPSYIEDKKEIDAIRNDMDELEYLCANHYDDEEDMGPDPDEYYERQRERKFENHESDIDPYGEERWGDKHNHINFLAYRNGLSNRESRELEELGYKNELDLTEDEIRSMEDCVFKLGDKVRFVDEDDDEIHIIDVINTRLPAGYMVDIDEGGEHVYGWLEDQDLEQIN